MYNYIIICIILFSNIFCAENSHNISIPIIELVPPEIFLNIISNFQYDKKTIASLLCLNKNIFNKTISYINSSVLNKISLSSNFHLNKLKINLPEDVIDVIAKHNLIVLVSKKNIFILNFNFDNSNETLIDLKTSKEIYLKDHSFQIIRNITHIYNNIYIISRYKNNIVGIWDINTGKLLKTIHINKMFYKNHVISKIYLYNNHILIIYERNDLRIVLYISILSLFKSIDKRLNVIKRVYNPTLENIKDYHINNNHIMYFDDSNVHILNLNTNKNTSFNHPDNIILQNIFTPFRINKYFLSNNAKYAILAYKTGTIFIINIEEENLTKINNNAHLVNITILNNEKQFLLIYSYKQAEHFITKLELCDIKTLSLINEQFLNLNNIDSIVIDSNDQFILISQNKDIYIIEIPSLKLLNRYKADTQDSISNLKISDTKNTLYCNHSIWFLD